MSVKIVLCAQQSSDWVSRLLDLQPGLTVADLKAYAAKFLAPEVSEIYIENPRRLAGGGSNGSRVRLWKRELQKLANELGLDIMVSHPGLRRGRLCRPAPASGTKSSTASSPSLARTGVPSLSSAIE